MSKFCSHCNKEYSDDFVFCPYCGKNLDDSMESEKWNYLLEIFETRRLRFGRYNDEEIVWDPKTMINNCVLLVADDILACGKFDEKSCDWNDSEIRRWLNNDFYNEAFNETEKKFIGDYLCGDKVFLLSAQEFYQYCPEDERIKKGTIGAKKQGLWVYTKGYSCWWLRSSDGTYVDRVDDIGGVTSFFPNSSHVGIVPAILLKI